MLCCCYSSPLIPSLLPTPPLPSALPSPSLSCPLPARTNPTCGATHHSRPLPILLVPPPLLLLLLPPYQTHHLPARTPRSRWAFHRGSLPLGGAALMGRESTRVHSSWQCCAQTCARAVLRVHLHWAACSHPVLNSRSLSTPLLPPTPRHPSRLVSCQAASQPQAMDAATPPSHHPPGSVARSTPACGGDSGEGRRRASHGRRESEALRSDQPLPEADADATAAAAAALRIQHGDPFTVRKSKAPCMW